jgi:AraC-like DNA-binding protein
MKILALLADDARQVLERSLTTAQKVSKAGGADSVAAALREKRCDAIVLDPGVLSAEEFETVLSAVNASGVPMLIYTTLSGLSARRIVHAVEDAAREVVLRGSDDAPEVLQRRLGALVAPTAPAILLSHAASRFRAFPERLQTVSVSLFGRASLPRWVNGLVKESGLARRTVDRWMHKGGISGAARLLDTARLARVWEPLVERNVAVEDVAVRCGYARMRLLTAHTRRIMGVDPTNLRNHYTRESFSARLSESLTN